jgi:NitT/TauT family transport system ATP-binding protein
MAKEQILTLSGVTKSYGGKGKTFTAVRDVNLRIEEGELVCLLGPSGCGKSTLLRIVAGLMPATSGQVLYCGQRVEGINPHATIVFQTFALFPWLTVEQNVTVALRARGVEPGERHARALRLIDTVGLDGFEKAYPRELSGGMRQKVGFARAMAVEPELLCLDEPFSALDVLSAEALRGELMELWLGKKLPTRAILMVTHNIEEAVLMADRIVVMGKNPGHVVTELPVELHHPRARKDTAFQALADRVYAAVAGRTPEGDGHATAAGQLRRLPAARVNAVSGLMERLNEEGGRGDLYRQAADLQLELDDLLPVLEASESLGFARVAEGDVFLTPLGKAFAEASILGRKEIVTARMLRHPTMLWIFETLKRDDNGRVAKSYFLNQLRNDFGEEADRQLDLAIRWGRYAEIFGFDDDTDELYLEPGP